MKGFDLGAIRDLRAVGVKAATVHWNSDSGVWVSEVEFFPPEPRASGPIVTREFSQNAPVGEETCACGHIQPAHNGDGLCLMGCPVESCARGPKDDSGKARV